MKIISLQVSEELLDRFEKARKQSGFSSKSEALRDSIVKFIFSGTVINCYESIVYM